MAILSINRSQSINQQPIKKNESKVVIGISKSIGRKIIQSF